MWQQQHHLQPKAQPHLPPTTMTKTRTAIIAITANLGAASSVIVKIPTLRQTASTWIWLVQLGAQWSTVMAVLGISHGWQWVLALQGNEESDARRNRSEGFLDFSSQSDTWCTCSPSLSLLQSTNKPMDQQLNRAGSMAPQNTIFSEKKGWKHGCDTKMGTGHSPSAKDIMYCPDANRRSLESAPVVVILMYGHGQFSLFKASASKRGRSSSWGYSNRAEWPQISTMVHVFNIGSISLYQWLYPQKLLVKIQQKPIPWKRIRHEHWS